MAYLWYTLAFLHILPPMLGKATTERRAMRLSKVRMPAYYVPTQSHSAYTIHTVSYQTNDYKLYYEYESMLLHFLIMHSL